MSRFEPEPRSAATEERELERLLTAAGPRPPLPEAELAAARAAARRAWRARHQAPPARSATTRRSPRKSPRWLLLAAAALVAALGGLAYRAAVRPPTPVPDRGSPPALVVAEVELVEGAVAVRDTGADDSLARILAAGDWVPAGAVVSVAARGEGRARLALRLDGGASLRVDSGSELTLAAADRIVLARGRIYLDSDSAAGGHAPAVETPLGRFVDLGTQYEVALDDATGAARLRVREGRVELRNGHRLEATAGEELAIAKDGGAARARLQRFGPEWEWVVESAPIPAIDGWTVERFLAWLAREGGVTVEYADAATAERARTVVVHGAVRQLKPFAAAEVVLASAGCRFTVEGERLLVGSTPATGR